MQLCNAAAAKGKSGFKIPFSMIQLFNTHVVWCSLLYEFAFCLGRSQKTQAEIDMLYSKLINIFGQETQK